MKRMTKYRYYLAIAIIKNNGNCQKAKREIYCDLSCVPCYWIEDNCYADQKPACQSTSSKIKDENFVYERTLKFMLNKYGEVELFKELI